MVASLTGLFHAYQIQAPRQAVHGNGRRMRHVDGIKTRHHGNNRQSFRSGLEGILHPKTFIADNQDHAAPFSQRERLQVTGASTNRRARSVSGASSSRPRANAFISASAADTETPSASRTIGRTAAALRFTRVSERAR